MLKNLFWQPKIEKASIHSLKKKQEVNLKSMVKYAYEKSVFYKRLLKEVDIKPQSIISLNDLDVIPFTTKEDFRSHYPFGLLAAPMSEICRVHASSGTTGDPTVVAYTRKDLENWSDCIARCLSMTGIGRGDIFQVILGYGLFTGGLGFHYGVEKIGAVIVPSSTGNTRRQVKLIKDLGVTAFTSIPSYSLYIAETAQDMGVDPSEDLQIKSISCGAEYWSQSVKEKLEDIFGCRVFNSYGLSELCGPGVAFECLEQDGLHLWMDHFLAEVIDPKTGEPLEAEEEGELVLTALTKEALPLLRYRTGDVTSLMDEKECECGRSHVKMSWISGRTDDMVKVKGVNVFPSQVEHAIMSVEGVGNNYQIHLTRRGYLDDMSVRVEAGKSAKELGEHAWRHLEKSLRKSLESIVGLHVDIKLLEPNSLPRVDGKAKRVVDERRS